ncbi:hypothetical protein Kpol_1066p2 [Vanderwaltozyma polyspora DSM 70294]|uniref:mRNA export factor GLE1 n=1 Tax=Vanderwaltozyma polyspora (strain ATCC 22028 / DSM 70294 / BCRC 21397 / CBS 2163 / NBRC 10782 / NRRL Y-8283 / UCD 57-17) TaxID=436907 RepID=A7TMM4_VANPO|nr:uncharacterized protein Kpol_1066p2 [Vanderwaltozyma polyspora DSM 70294]EDO16438.1 hypothetical protein Kpol_1066p2 [Vanderwaltozyma polyspora DSM 70294]
MRFVFDEIFNISDDEGEEQVGVQLTEDDLREEEESPLTSPQMEYTYINESEEEEGIPHLKLPRKKFLDTNNQDQIEGDKSLEPVLEDDVVEMLNALKLQGKLLNARESTALPIVPSYKQLKECLKSTDVPLLSTGRDTILRDDSGERLLKLQNDFNAKIENISSNINKQIDSIVKIRTQKEEEERRRKAEEERRRKEEEEHRRKEEEERKRKEEELKRQKEEGERKRKEEEIKRQAELKEKEAKQLLEKQKYESNKKKEVTNFNEIDKTFKHYKDKIIEIKETIIQPVKNGDASMKKILSQHKRKINPKFGQLTNSNGQLRNVTNALITLIDETKVDKLPYLWILNFIAKAIVSQSETEVRVKPESALPLAKLSLILMVKYSELKELLMARFVKKCPFVIGYTCSIDTEEGRLRMGWKRSGEDNKWEEDTTYDERMGGMMTLYAVITRLPIPTEYVSDMNTVVHPLGISESWRVLARICNLDSQLITNTHFICVASWWEAAAKEFVEKYSNQGRKLLKLVGVDLVQSVQEKKYIGSARLSILVEEWMQNNVIKSFPSMDP